MLNSLSIDYEESTKSMMEKAKEEGMAEMKNEEDDE